MATRAAGRGILKVHRETSKVNDEVLQPGPVVETPLAPDASKPVPSLRNRMLLSALSRAPPSAEESSTPGLQSGEPQAAPVRRQQGRGICVKRDEVHQPGSIAVASPVASTAAAATVQNKNLAAVEEGVKAINLNGNLPSPADKRNGHSEPSIQPLSHSNVPPEERIGTNGKHLPLGANYVRLVVEQDTGIYEHEVTFSPAIESRSLRFQLLKQHMDFLGPGHNFDGVTLYLSKMLSQKTVVLKSSHPADGTAVELKIIFRRERSMKECIHFYNILFRRIMAALEMVQSGRSYYNPSSSIAVPEHKLVIWPGYVTAVHEMHGGLFLCADVSFRVLRTATVLDLMKEIASKTRGNFLDEVKKEIIGRTVITKYNNKTWKVDEILTDENPLSTFTRGGVTVSYVDYYRSQYGIEISDRKQFLLLSRVTKKALGKEEITMTVQLIPELCHISGLDDTIRKDHRIMKALDTHMKISPEKREFCLRSFITSVNSNEKAARILKEWGLSLSPEIVTLQGRQLDKEKIFLGNHEFVTNDVCDWSREATTRRVLSPVDIVNWAIVFMSRDSNLAKNFADMLVNVSRDLGFMVAKPRLVALPDDKNITFTNAIKTTITPELQIIVVMTPTQREDRYKAIKVLCNADMPIPSQVVLSKTLSRQDRLRSVVQKIALQMNCKLGGELWSVHIPMKLLMVCGIDVYHDPTRGGRSVAGFVSSSNAAATRWYNQSCYQQPGQELVDELKKCLVKSVAVFYKANHDFPKTIVIFRDGVGDGRLETTARHEVAQLVQALSLVKPDYNPKLCFIVVSKRINTRIFSRGLAGRNGIQWTNPPPGTVVDHTITKKDIWDFLLVSQHSRQGTVSPTHFTVLRDGGLKPDHIQRLSYKMTHLYFNWPGTIRVPAPCQYAHKLAEMVGSVMHKEVSELLADRLSFL